MNYTEFPDPFVRFQEWFAKAEKAEPNLPDAMTLATVDAKGRPSARMVLLKGADERGFVFYTNMDSRKGEELGLNAHAALVFHWKSVKRQVRVTGAVERVSDAEADDYFASRARGAQIGAWASDQSRPMQGAHELEKRVARFTAKFGVSRIPRPDFWSGYRLVPDEMEFWEERLFRLHSRIHYQRAGDGWNTTYLFP
jgi:pyridoxamine 5'-phosphate oxidase